MGRHSRYRLDHMAERPAVSVGDGASVLPVQPGERHPGDGCALPVPDDRRGCRLSYGGLSQSKGGARHGDDRIRVVGTRGVLEVRGPELTLINPDAQGIQQIDSPGDGELFAGFLDQIQGKGRCRLSAEDSFYATQAAIRAQMAADSGEKVVF